MVLTPDVVANIHNIGGTILGSDRGGLVENSPKDVDIILRFCLNRGINQLYIIGGDGTHRGADAIAKEAQARGIPMAVAAIPKTIDNDVDIIDRSFGFETAYSEAQQAIRSAKTEASAALNGLGIVKLMGRHAGFIAAHATMASGDVDLCLIPEVPVVFSGPASFGAHVQAVIRRKGHAVVVVAEGAGE
jgi:6-phosphofructokinase 1